VESCAPCRDAAAVAGQGRGEGAGVIAKAKAEGEYKGRKQTDAVQAEQIRAMRAAAEKPAHIARRLGAGWSSVNRMLEGALGTSGGLPGAAVARAAG